MDDEWTTKSKLAYQAIWGTVAINGRLKAKQMVVRGGFEPPTPGFSVVFGPDCRIFQTSDIPHYEGIFRRSFVDQFQTVLIPRSGQCVDMSKHLGLAAYLRPRSILSREEAACG